MPPLSFDWIAVLKKTEFTKKMETQTLSPTKRSVVKPAARQTRPTQHHSCPRRRTTGDPLCRSVTQVALFVFSTTKPPQHKLSPNSHLFCSRFLCVFLFFITIKFLVVHLILSSGYFVFVLFVFLDTSFFFFSCKCNVTPVWKHSFTVIEGSLNKNVTFRLCPSHSSFTVFCSTDFYFVCFLMLCHINMSLLVIAWF